MVGYEVGSAIGALKPTGWNTISGHFDDSSNGGNESVDDDDVWTVLSNTGASYSNNLAEFAFGGPGGPGNGATLAANQEIDLGQAWFPTPFESDLTMTIVNSDGTHHNVAIVFTGNGDNPLKRSDFDHDGAVDIDDWNTFNSNRPSDLSAFPLAQAYLRGDLNGDGVNDGNDFLLFVHDYELDHGSGSFAQMLHAVPEPASLILIGACALGLVGFRKRPFRRCLPLLVLGCLMIASNAQAASLGWYRLGDDDPAPFNGANLPAAGTLNSAGTFGPMTPSATESGSQYWPQYSNIVPATVIHDPIANQNYFDQWSVATDGSSERQRIHTGNETTPSGAFTFETFVRFDNVATSYGVDFAYHTAGTDGGWRIELSNEAGSQGKVRALMESPNDMGDLALLSTTTLQDNQWYHVALVFDGNLGGTTNDVHLYIDGANEANGNYTNGLAFGNTAHPLYLGNVFDADVVRVDEARYYDEAHAPSQFLQIATDYTLTAVVNISTGAVSLHNDTTGAITINDYELNSPAHRLLASWDGLGNLDAVGGGDDPGETWENHGILSDQHIGESFLLGSSTIAAGGSLNIGTAYLAGAEDGDLTFRYTDVGLGGFLTGGIEFTTGGLVGDYNEDDVVDAADYTVWRDHLGTAFDLPNRDPDNSGNISQDDYDSWKGNFGAVAGSGALANLSSNVPEPASVMLLLAAGGLASLRIRTRLVPLRVVTALVALAVFTCTAAAATNALRNYKMGDDPWTSQRFSNFWLEFVKSSPSLGNFLSTAVPQSPVQWGKCLESRFLRLPVRGWCTQDGGLIIASASG